MLHKVFKEEGLAFPKTVELIIYLRFMPTVPLIFPGNYQISVPNRVCLEFFPNDIQSLSSEKQAWIQQSNDIVYKIGEQPGPYIEFLVKSAAIEHSNLFLAGQ